MTLDEITIPPTRTGDRTACSESAATVNIPASALLLGFFAVACVVALCLSVYAIGRADAAAERARLAERETRIMQDDLKYIRAYASARGLFIPADHDQAEEYPNVSQNHFERRSIERERAKPIASSAPR